MKTNKLFDLNKMSHALCEKKVTKTEFVVYTIIFILLSAAGLFMMRPGEYISTSVFYANIIGMFVYTIAWFSLAYTANKKGDGKDFWYRFISLDLAITIIIGAVVFVGAILYGFFISPHPADLQEMPKMDWGDFYLVVLISIANLYLIHKYMHFISHGCKKQITEEEK
ncbi:hypothetical protein ACFL22_00700 [Patescibacteria group bacterium]